MTEKVGKAATPDIPSEWLADFESIAAHLATILALPVLLQNVWGKHHEGTCRQWLGVTGSAGKYGHTDPNVDRWPLLQRWLLHHPAIRPRWQWLVAEGFDPRFVESSDANWHSLFLELAIDEPTLEALKRAAKFAMGVTNARQDAAFDARFDLYLKQNWTSDDTLRNQWREREPLAVWPWRPEEGEEAR